MIKAALKLWLYRAFLLLAIAAALLVSHYSAWDQSLPSVITSLVVLMFIVICTIYAWNGDEEDEPVTQPIQPAPTIIAMPTVHLEPVDLPMIAPLSPTPYADVMDAWLREQQRAMQEKLRGNDEDGGGVVL